MSQHTHKRLSDDAGKWLGWIAILIGVIGFFFEPIMMGFVALVLASIGLVSSQKTLNGIAIAIGVIALVIGFF